MAVESLQIELGTNMPAFQLSTPEGTSYKGSDLIGENGLIVGFMCNHCPYAKAIWPRLIELSKEAEAKGIKTIAINPNINPDYPEDAPPIMKDRISEWGIPFPYLVDETQETARAFQAQCTPDLYLFDGSGKLVYHGRLDDNWKEPENVTRHEFKEAIAGLLDGQTPPDPQSPAMGCSIKWVNP